MISKSNLALMLVAMAMPFAASAAITQTFGDRASYLTAAVHVTSAPLDLTGGSPVFVSQFVSGALTVTAQDGGLAGDGTNIVSTEFDSDVLILTFANPVFGVGLSGGVTDADFAYIDGQLGIEVVGSGFTSFTANGGAAFFGLLSDVGFTQLRINVDSFDTDASSIAFATLQESVDAAVTVPEPMTWTMLILGFGMLGAIQRFRRTVSAA